MLCSCYWQVLVLRSLALLLIEVEGIIVLSPTNASLFIVIDLLFSYHLGTLLLSNSLRIVVE